MFIVELRVLSNLSMLFTLFNTHVYLVYIYLVTLNLVAFKYRYHDKKSSPIRVVYFNLLQSALTERRLVWRLVTKD